MIRYTYDGLGYTTGLDLTDPYTRFAFDHAPVVERQNWGEIVALAGERFCRPYPEAGWTHRHVVDEVIPHEDLVAGLIEIGNEIAAACEGWST